MRSHKHIERQRVCKKTQEVLIVFKGSCLVRIFNKDNSIKYTGKLNPGSFCIVYDGGVGYTVLEDDTIMMEVKNGDYLVNSDDEDREYLENKDGSIY
jgi:hypothetical protein